MRGAIVLAGGKSERLGRDKALLRFRDKPLIEHGLERARRACDEVVIACRDEEQKRRLMFFGNCVVDRREGWGPLEGMACGCAHLQSGYAFVFGCDMPFLCEEALDFLFESAEGHSASIPSYPNGRFEPLHSVYHVEETREACERAFEKGKKKIFDMVDLLPDIVYVPVQAMRSFDPRLETFININTPKDMEEYG